MAEVCRRSVAGAVLVVAVAMDVTVRRRPLDLLDLVMGVVYVEMPLDHGRPPGAVGVSYL